MRSRGNASATRLSALTAERTPSAQRRSPGAARHEALRVARRLAPTQTTADGERCTGGAAGTSVRARPTARAAACVLAARAAAARDAWDADAAVQTLRLAAAWLREPVLGGVATQGAMEAFPSGVLATQSWVRLAIADALQVLDLNDAGTLSLVAFELEAIRRAMGRAVERGMRLHECRGGREWLGIGALLPGPHMADALVDVSLSADEPTPRASLGQARPRKRARRAAGDRQSSQRCPHGKLKCNCVVCSPCAHGNLRRFCKQCCACPHGRVKWDCQKCRGCPHGRMKSWCPECNGCPHGKLRRLCKACSACPHGKVVKYCGECNPCPHGKLRKACLSCVGCPHGKFKHSCPSCKGCPHGRLKHECAACTGCPHGKVKRRCDVCSGCPHGKLPRRCAECNGCVHGVPKWDCKVCHGCPHGKLVASCVKCRGCPHGRLKKNCSQCSGCPHGRVRSKCVSCKRSAAG